MLNAEDGMHPIIKITIVEICTVHYTGACAWGRSNLPESTSL